MSLDESCLYIQKNQVESTSDETIWVMSLDESCLYIQKNQVESTSDETIWVMSLDGSCLYIQKNHVESTSDETIWVMSLDGSCLYIQKNHVESTSDETLLLWLPSTVSIILIIRRNTIYSRPNTIYMRLRRLIQKTHIACWTHTKDSYSSRYVMDYPIYNQLASPQHNLTRL
jgi:hypothetical protein